MRTLVLLAALLLVAFQARAQRLQETADQVTAQDQLEAEDQDQAGAEDQDMAITFTAEASAGPITNICKCRSGTTCGPFARHSGSCKIRGRWYLLCCR